MHFALESYLKMRQLAPNLDFLMQKFEESIKKEFLSERDRQDLNAKGEKAFKNFLENMAPHLGDRLQSELSIRGVKLESGVVLNGRLDMLEYNGSLKEVVVHDFKTGRPKSRSQIDGSKEDSSYNYLRQLTFYKLLLERHKNGMVKMTSGMIDFIEPDEKGRFKSEKFEISENSVKVLEDQINFVSGEIINLDFWDRKCDDEKCEYCHLRSLTMGQSTINS